MKKACSLFFIVFLLLCGQNLFARESTLSDEDFPVPEWDDFIVTPYSAGDRTFIISLGALFPTVFGGAIENNQHGIRLGGLISGAFNYYITPNIFVGGELSGSFNGTRGGNMLYMIPFGVRAGYQFLFNRFEFPVTLMVGGAAQRYLGRGHFGPIIKPSVAGFWRFSPEWSFGLNSAWWFVPQWPSDGPTVYGNFMELTLSARFHF